MMMAPPKAAVTLRQEPLVDAPVGDRFRSDAVSLTSIVWEAEQVHAIDSAFHGALRVLWAVRSPFVRRQKSDLTRSLLLQRINAKVAGGLLDIDQLRADALTFVHQSIARLPH
jgi:hypothetical protein